MTPIVPLFTTTFKSPSTSLYIAPLARMKPLILPLFSVMSTPPTVDFISGTKSGLGKNWVQNVLRHTYASFHAKKYADLPRLQLNMGHRDQSLLRSRYVNMRGLSKSAANSFFGDSFSTLARCGSLFGRA